MAPIKLKPPEWREVPEHCANCGYSLEGLSSPGTCPECGFRFDAHTLVMIGIPRRGRTASPMRRTAWGVVLGVAVVWLHCLGFATFEPTVFFAVGVGWLIGLIALLATGKRERSVTQPIIFAAGGFGLASDADTETGRTLLPWSAVNGYTFDRIGANWYRLQLGQLRAPVLNQAAAGWQSVKFEAGVRCADELADRVRDTLAHHIEFYA